MLQKKTMQEECECEDRQLGILADQCAKLTEDMEEYNPCTEVWTKKRWLDWSLEEAKRSLGMKHLSSQERGSKEAKKK